MIRNYEPRHIVLAIAIMVLVISPFILLVLPTAVIKSIYHTPAQLVVYVTSASYLVYGAGLLFFSLSIFAIFFLWGKKTMILAILICLILSGYSFYIASQHYISIGTDNLAYQLLFSPEEHIYDWDEFETAIYYYDEDEEIAPTYEFTFNDGESVTLPENKYIEEYKYLINNLLKNEGIIVEEKFYE